MPTEQPSVPSPESPTQRPRPSAEETFKHYGVLSLIGAAFLAWFIRDGWFNDDPKMLEHLAFNRWGSLVVGLVLAFFLVMCGSAGLTLLRQRKQKTPPPS